MSTQGTPTPPAYPPLSDPLQSPAASFDASKLEKAVEYTAQSYRAQFGADPPYNPGLPIKTWADPSAATMPPWNYLPYESIQKINGVYQMAPFSLPAHIAMEVNIPPGWPLVPSPAPVTPVPMRALLPNEEISKSFGVFSQAIIRTDMPQSGIDAPPAPSADSSTLSRILAGLEAIAKQMGITVAILLALSFLAHAQTTNPLCPQASGPSPHCVILAWTAPTTGPAPTSYNVYTGGTTAGQCAALNATTCTKIGTVAANVLTFTYNSSASVTFVEGKTYFFVATSVNGNAESGPSPEVSVAVPFLMPAPPVMAPPIAH